jgi:hypothetical protein
MTVILSLTLMAAEPTPGEAAWKKLRTLAGVCEGTEAGRTTTMTYAVVSDGHTLIESMRMPAPSRTW